MNFLPELLVSLMFLSIAASFLLFTFFVFRIYSKGWWDRSTIGSGKWLMISSVCLALLCSVIVYFAPNNDTDVVLAGVLWGLVMLLWLMHRLQLKSYDEQKFTI